ncbi:hypothetical protein TNCV_903541 [Trichonephila clavipes]|nr:hypothetical protein TNCV_903541 [Trichonephila clavipes]
MRADLVCSSLILIHTHLEKRGSRNHPSNIIERDRYGGPGVLVWGSIVLGSCTRPSHLRRRFSQRDPLL